MVELIVTLVQCSMPLEEVVVVVSVPAIWLRAYDHDSLRVDDWRIGCGFVSDSRNARMLTSLDA